MRPQVFGYLHCVRADPTMMARLARRIALYAKREYLDLAHVFADSGVRGTVLLRPAFAVVLEELAKPDVSGLIIPSLDHLSRCRQMRAILERRLDRIGAVLYIMPHAGGHDDHVRAGRAARWSSR